MPRTSQMLTKLLWYLPGGLVPAVFGLVSSYVFTTLLTTEQYGLYSLVYSVCTVLVAVTSQWLEQGINRYLPVATDPEGTLGIKRAIVSGGVLILAVVGLLTVVWFGGVTLAGWSDGYAVGLASLVFVAAHSIWAPATTVLQAELEARRFSVYQSCQAALRFVASLGFAWMIGPLGLLWGQAVGTLALLPFLLRDTGLLEWHEWRFASFRRNWSTVLTFLQYGIPMVGWYLAATILQVGDRWMIQLLGTVDQVGLYAANYALVSGAVSIASAPVLRLMHPLLMRRWADKEKGGVGDTLGRTVVVFSVIALAVTGATALFSRDIAKWFLGPAFREGHVIMPAVVAGILCWNIGMYTHKPLEFYGHTGRLFVLSVLTAGLNLLLNFLFIPLFGYVAAAYTTLASYLAYAVAAGLMGQALLPWKMQWSSVGGWAAGILVTCVTAHLLRTYVARVAGEWFGLGVALLIVGLLGGGLLWWLVRYMRTDTGSQSTEGGSTT